VLDWQALIIYLSIFLALIAAGVGFPIPEELPIVTAGVWTGHSSEPPRVEPGFVGLLAVAPDASFPANLPWLSLVETSRYEPPVPKTPLRWWIMLPICILGVVISDGLLYGMGRFGGRRLLTNRWVTRLLPHQKRERIEENFHRYGVLVLLFARFLPTIRAPIFIMAGVLRLSFARFLLADGLYALPGVSLLFFLAYWFGDQVRALVERAEAKAKPLVILVAIAAVAAYLLYHFLRHPVTTGDPKELPLVGDQVAAKLEGPDGEPPVLRDGDWPCPDGSRPRLRQPEVDREENSVSGRPPE
jgi:membrane protein DedA with SNARE-associated domain